MTPWEKLLQRLTNARTWPVPQEARVRQQIAVWAALRESDEDTLRQLMSWPADRPLMIDNLPEKIATAFGDLIFGKAPSVTAADEADQEALQDMTEGWFSDLPGAEETCISEGEVWWRLVGRDGGYHPVPTWHSRADVVPLLFGKKVMAAAFVSKLNDPSRTDRTVFRHVELHGKGVVHNLLLRGTSQALGARVALTRHDETADLLDRWDTGLEDLLCGRVVNRWGRTPIVGVSAYQGVWQRFLALNEATTIGRENVRLTAKKRMVLPAGIMSASQPIGPSGRADSDDRGDGVRVPKPITPNAPVDLGADVLFDDPLDDEQQSRPTVLEYSFDAAPLIAYLTYETETICQRCDVVPQFIGNGDFGTGSSGTALKVRLLPTVNAAEGRGREWDQELPEIARRGQMLESLQLGDGGFAIDWKDPTTAPAIVRSETLPTDPMEVAMRDSTLKTASLVSIETSLRERYPDNDETWFAEERARIIADTADTLPAPSTFGGGPPPGTEDPPEGDPPPVDDPAAGPVPPLEE